MSTLTVSNADEKTLVHGIRGRHHAKISRFLRLFGPAWIVMIADVDVASIITGLQSGASFGFRLIFVELILTAPLAVIQYVSGGVAIYSGKGIAENVRQQWGKRSAYVAAMPMALTDFLSYVAEYSGIAIGFELLGLNPVLGIVIAFIMHNILILSRKFEKVEVPLLVVSMVLVVSLVLAAAFSHPDIPLLFTQGLNPIQPYGNPSYLYLVVANIGAVIMPWMIFYQAGANVEKKLDKKHIRFQKWETFLGALASEMIMAAIIVAASGISGGSGLQIGSLMKTLTYLGGASHFLLAVGFIAAGFLALVVISLSSAWGVCEAAGIKFRFSSRIRERKGFYLIFLLESFPAMLLSIYASTNLIALLIDLMVIYVLVDIPVLLMVGLLVRKEHLVGKKFFSRSTMIMYWIFFALIEITGIYSIVTSGIPGL